MGESWECALHDGWTIQEWSQLVGRVTDFKSAYKQLPRHPAHAVEEPGTKKVRLFEALSLMFGATAAVYAFLRISRALGTIARRLFHFNVVEFFDDFSQVEASALAQSSQDTMEGEGVNLIRILGLVPSPEPRPGAEGPIR